MPRVLLVEDSEADVFLVEEALAIQGVQAKLEVVRDGEEAIRRVARIEAKPDEICPALILLDLNLPRRTGEEVLHEIRKSSRLKNIPVIIVTSSDSSLDRKRTESLGASRYFQKPSEYDAFMKIGEIVKELLQPQKL